MLRPMDMPGVPECIFPDVEAVKATFRERLAIDKDPTAYRESLPGGRATKGQGRKIK